MTRVLAVDPGTAASGIVLWDGDAKRVVESLSEIGNEELLDRLLRGGFAFSPVGDEMVVFEKIESMGMAVGASTFETVFWTGRFYEVASHYAGVCRVTRREVKLHICGSMKAKDPNVRQALIDRFGEPGTKKNPGPLYGVSSHAWAALALAVTWFDQNKEKS